MKLTAIEWNIHGGAAFSWNNGYEIKKWVVDEIMKDKSDIIILTEFVIANGWDYFQGRLENYYQWFISTSTGTNGILIAIKNREKFDVSDISAFINGTINTNEILDGVHLPDFYEVKIKVNSDPLSIIGTRTRKDIKKIYGKNYTKEQFSALDKYLSNINHDFICMGDFNAYWGKSWKTDKNTTLTNTSKIDKISLCTPSYNPDIFSYVLPNGKKVSLDHCITTLKIKNSEYDWRFLCDKYGYKGITKESPNKPTGIPDHAMLKVEFDL